MLPRLLLALGFACIVAVALLIGQREPVPVYAATITVNTTADELTSDGNCSLREAVQAANTHTTVDACTAGAGANTIVVPAGTYTLTIPPSGSDDNLTGDLNVASDTTINGAGIAQTIIQACDSSGGPCYGPDRILHVEPGATATISGVTIRNGAGYGGGIWNGGSLMLASSAVRGNFGSGILNVPATTNTSATATVTNSVISGNEGGNSLSGGIQNNGTLTVSNSDISGNHTLSDGGGIGNFGALNLASSTISGNVAAVGGGISNEESGVDVTATISNSTISGNRAVGGINGNGGLGGGILNYRAKLTVEFSTVSGNSATSNDGGGIDNDPLVGLTTDLKNTIVADSPRGGNCGGAAVNSDGHNLSSDGTCAFAGNGDLNNANPLLGPLANNGGPTRTQALMAGSPAIDAVPLGDCTDTLGNPVTTDQRGVVRPQGPACEVGAYEAPFVPPPAATPTATATPTIAPIRVGGVADVHVGPGPASSGASGSSRSRADYAAIAMGLTTVLAGVGWYVRRRLAA